MNRPENKKELYELFGELCNETITPEQHDRLMALLESDAESRRLYCDYVDVHLELENAGSRDEHLRPFAQLKAELDRITEGKSPAKPLPTRQIQTQLNSAPRWITGLSYVAVIAATTLAMFAVQRFQPTDEIAATDPRQIDVATIAPEPTVVPEYVATLLKSADCRWSGEHRPQFDGQRLLSRNIQLEEGLAELGFDSGVRIILQGPARLSINSSSTAVLHSGKLVLHGHESAAPFSLDTPTSTLLDIGTEYGASVSEDNMTEVRVFSGEVQVKPLQADDDTAIQTLLDGDAAKFDGQGRIEATVNDTQFVRLIPDSILPQMRSEQQLLAYEGFDYNTDTLASADGGSGFRGPWRHAIPTDEPSKVAMYRKGSLSISGESNSDQPNINQQGGVGGALDMVGAVPSARTLETPIRLDADAVYYVSFLLQKVAGAPRGKSQYMSFSFRTADSPEDPRKLHFGVTSEQYLTMTHNEKEVIVAPPLVTGQTYMYVAKIVAGEEAPDQLMLRVFGPGESVRPDEPLVWNCVTPAQFDDTVFDQLLIFCARSGHFRTDEIRIGTTWESVTMADH